MPLDLSLCLGRRNPVAPTFLSVRSLQPGVYITFLAPWKQLGFWPQGELALFARFPQYTCLPFGQRQNAVGQRYHLAGSDVPLGQVKNRLANPFWRRVAGQDMP